MGRGCSIYDEVVELWKKYAFSLADSFVLNRPIKRKWLAFAAQSLSIYVFTRGLRIEEIYRMFSILQFIHEKYPMNMITLTPRKEILQIGLTLSITVISEMTVMIVIMFEHFMTKI